MSIKRQIITTLSGTLCLAPLLALASTAAPLPAPQSTVQQQPLLLAFGMGSGGPSRSGRDYRRGESGPGYNRGSMGRGPSMGGGGPGYGPGGPGESGYGPGYGPGQRGGPDGPGMRRGGAGYGYGQPGY